MNFTRTSNTLRSDCGGFEIIRMRLHLGQAHAAYRLMAEGVPLPELLAIKPTEAEAIALCETSQRYGGAP